MSRSAHGPNGPVDTYAGVEPPPAWRPGTYPAAPGFGAGVDLRDIVALIRRNLLWIGLAVLLGGALGVGIGKLLPKRYQAEGLLVIDTRELTIPEFQSIRSSRTVEPWGGRSEARVLASRELVAAVAAKLDLLHDPSFNPTLRANPVGRWVAQAPWLPDTLRERLREEPDFGPEIQAEIVHRILADLAASSEERSYAITVRYTGLDPVTSARLINELMELYLQRDVEAKRRTVAQARVQLKQRLDELHADLEATRGKIRALEGSGGALEANGATITAQQVAAVALERRQIGDERARVEADLRQLEAGLESNRISVINEKLVTPRLEALWQTEAALQRTQAESAITFGLKHPRMAALQSELTRVRTEIRGEVTAIQGGLRQRRATLAAREAELARQHRDAELVAAASAEGRTMLAQLEAEATSKQALYDLYRNRYEQTLANAELFSPDARIVSYAEPPTKPATPSAKLRGLIGGAIGLLASLGLIVGRRWLHDGIDTLDDAQQICGVTPLGGIPRVGGWGRRTKVTDLVLREPQSAVAATIRGILYRITFGQATTPLKVVMVTSPLPQDGKSSLVAAMVRIGARDGLRCLAIDCDLYRPSLARMIGVTPPLYLNDPSARHAALEDLRVVDAASGAHFILARPSSGPIDPLPVKATHLLRLVNDAQHQYDLVVIDTPPLLAVVDPMVLSRAVDAAVLVLPWRTVSRKLVHEAMQRLADFACPLVGVVLSRVAGRAHASYAYLGYETRRA